MKGCVSAEIDSRVTLWHFALNQQLRFNRRNHKDSENNNKQGVARRAKNKKEITSSLFESYLYYLYYVRSATVMSTCCLFDGGYITPRVRSSKAVSAALAPSPIAIIICL